MTLNDFHSDYTVIPIDDIIDDGDYEFGIITIPRRTQSAPPTLDVPFQQELHAPFCNSTRTCLSPWHGSFSISCVYD